jgi:hypothetical protein
MFLQASFLQTSVGGSPAHVVKLFPKNEAEITTGGGAGEDGAGCFSVL